MKEIKLPITQKFSLNIKPQEISSCPVSMEDGRLGVFLGEIVNQDISNLLEVARGNGGKVLYATTSIEQQIEAILLLYFMGPFRGYDERRETFEVEILQSSALSFKDKKELLIKIMNSEDLIYGKKKNTVSKLLKKIMDWRNAFAHGKVQHDNREGVLLNYYSGGPKKIKLSDECWTDVENCFDECYGLLKEIHDNLSQ